MALSNVDGDKIEGWGDKIISEGKYSRATAVYLRLLNILGLRGTG